MKKSIATKEQKHQGIATINAIRFICPGCGRPYRLERNRDVGFPNRFTCDGCGETFKLVVE